MADTTTLFLLKAVPPLAGLTFLAEATSVLPEGSGWFSAVGLSGVVVLLFQALAKKDAALLAANEANNKRLDDKDERHQQTVRELAAAANKAAEASVLAAGKAAEASLAGIKEVVAHCAEENRRVRMERVRGGGRANTDV